MRKIINSTFILLLIFILSGCSDPVGGKKFSVYYDSAVSAGATDLSYEEWIESIRGEDGREIELKVEEDILYCKYDTDSEWTMLIDFKDEQEEITITFLSEGSSINSNRDELDIVINTNRSTDLPIPIRTGHTFLGWFTGDSVNDGQVYNSTVFDRNITLTARWEITNYNLSLWNPTAVELLDSYEVPFGSPLLLPIIVKEGYAFIGWYKDPLLTEPLDFVLMPDRNLELFAKLELID